MAYIVLVINVPNEAVPQLNARAQLPTKVPEDITACTNILDAINAGCLAANVQVTTRDTDPGVSTSGANSEQNNYNHL